MFKWTKFFTEAFFKSSSKNNAILASEKDLILISIVIDTKTEEIGLLLDAHPYNIEDKEMIPQAEKLANGLFLLCGDKTYLTKLILDNINQLKKTSPNHSMFFENVLFFWNHYLNTKPTNTDNDPMIKPSKVFKNN